MQERQRRKIMSYTIYNTDGSILTTIVDGTIDETTDLKLIGKNSTGFGESFNEDLVYLLENCAVYTKENLLTMKYTK